MPIERIKGTLYVDEVALPNIVAFAGTPAYVYSWSTIQDRVQELKQAFRDLTNTSIHYAVKANSNVAILNRLRDLGLGFDVVSSGELERVLRAKGEPANVVFSGVGKSREELSFALKLNVGCINIESESEYRRICELCDLLNVSANIAFRVNPEIDANTHPYIATALKSSKFGLDPNEALRLARNAHERPSMNLVGLACHIGSQVAAIEPYGHALDQLLDLAAQLDEDRIPIRSLDLGGGFGIRYKNEKELSFSDLATIVQDRLHNKNISVALEPGRSLVAEAGVLVTKIEYLKRGVDGDSPNFAVVDAAMNDLIRPALYSAWHEIEPVFDREGARETWNVVGPVCESGDFLGLERTFCVSEGDLLAIRNAGAYGFVFSSNYNSRMRIPEVLIDGKEMHLIRSRESIHDMLELERLA